MAAFFIKFFTSLKMIIQFTDFGAAHNYGMDHFTYCLIELSLSMINPVLIFTVENST